MQLQDISYQTHPRCSNWQLRPGAGVHIPNCLHHERGRIHQKAHCPGLGHVQEEIPAVPRTEGGLVSAAVHTGSDGRVLRHNSARNPVNGAVGSDNPGQAEVCINTHQRT